MSLWENSIYRFRVPVDNEERVDLKEIVVDVTGSAPPFKEPSTNLKYVLDDVLPPEKGMGIDSILEFGAAKLKNIPYLLSKEKMVCAVEFESLAQNSLTQQNLEKCHEYGAKFQELIYPNPFLSDAKRFDLVLLANVLPVMPVPAERLYVLKVLYDKLRPNKYLLWVAQKEGTMYRKVREEGKNALGDGVWMGKGRRIKTFYRYHPVDELDEIMALFGFLLHKKWSLSDDARLYVKTPHTVMNDLLTPELLQRYLRVDNTIADPTSGTPKIVKHSEGQVVVPNPAELALESLYIERLRELDPGPQNAEVYHRLTANAIARVFKGSLRNMTLKVPVGDGTKVIDTVFSNAASEGFFSSLQRQVPAPFPIFEMKNYTEDPQNNEFDQLAGRLNDQRGHFGVLVCRNVEDQAAYRRCKTFLPNNYVLFLTDDDIIELLEYRINNDEQGINDFMDGKLRRLLF